MSIDESRNWKHAQMIEDPDEPTWLRMAREQEAREKAYLEREAMELAAMESPEAEEARWRNRFRQSARERERVHYLTD